MEWKETSTTNLYVHSLYGVKCTQPPTACTMCIQQNSPSLALSKLKIAKFTCTYMISSEFWFVVCSRETRTICSNQTYLLFKSTLHTWDVQATDNRLKPMNILQVAPGWGHFLRLFWSIAILMPVAFCMRRHFAHYNVITRLQFSSNQRNERYIYLSLFILLEWSISHRTFINCIKYLCACKSILWNTMNIWIFHVARRLLWPRWS